MENFGEFIKNKRIEKGITLRKIAEDLRIAPSYLSDIENGRRNAPEKPLLEKIAGLLDICSEDLNLFYDLAGKSRNEVAPDLPEYINENESVRVLLRTAKEKASNEQIQNFIKELEKK